MDHCENTVIWIVHDWNLDRTRMEFPVWVGWSRWCINRSFLLLYQLQDIHMEQDHYTAFTGLTMVCKWEQQYFQSVDSSSYQRSGCSAGFLARRLFSCLIDLIPVILASWTAPSTDSNLWNLLKSSYLLGEKGKKIARNGLQSQFWHDLWPFDTLALHLYSDNQQHNDIQHTCYFNPQHNGMLNTQNGISQR